MKMKLLARNRSHAVAQLERALVGNVRDLDGGTKTTVPACIEKLLIK